MSNTIEDVQLKYSVLSSLRTTKKTFLQHIYFNFHIFRQSGTKCNETPMKFYVLFIFPPLSPPPPTSKLWRGLEPARIAFHDHQQLWNWGKGVENFTVSLVLSPIVGFYFMLILCLVEVYDNGDVRTEVITFSIARIIQSQWGISARCVNIIILAVLANNRHLKQRRRDGLGTGFSYPVLFFSVLNFPSQIWSLNRCIAKRAWNVNKYGYFQENKRSSYDSSYTPA